MKTLTPRHSFAGAVVGFALLGGVLSACSGDDDDGESSAPTSVEEDADNETVTGPPMGELNGEELYLQVCAACHQPGGTGIEGSFPPLVDNPFVALEDPAPVASTVVHGRAGMPGFGPALSDTEIAAILTYLRTELNDGEAVDPQVVAAARSPEAIDEDPRDETEGDVGEEDAGE